MKITSNRSTEYLAARWEAQRAVRNLMGRLSQEILYRGEGRLFDRFWSRRKDVSLGVNEGWYLGPKAIRAYYDSFAAEAALSDQVLRQRFPSLMPADASNLGQFDLKPLSSDLVEVAEDGLSAKGMWACQGSDVRMTAKGPVSYWTMGIYAGDFLPEEGGWRLWHLLELRDIDCPCGEQWWRGRIRRPDEPGFEAMKTAGRPEPTIKTELHALWSPGGTGGGLPECPQPYESFGKTFSYGYERGARHAG